MQPKQAVNLKEYKELIETIAKVEYQKLSAGHMIEYLELVNIGTQTLYNLFEKSSPDQFNNSYLSTAIKWAIRNEIRRRYKWYSMRNRRSGSSEDHEHEHEELREAVYKTILSIDEMADAESHTQIKDCGRNPEESMEFMELKVEIVEAIKKLPQRERELIESKFFKDKKLREIAAEFDISPSRISRIIQSGLNRIKRELGKQDII
jgi:RNA polymerase sigma factor (sigma-70 family)